MPSDHILLSSSEINDDDVKAVEAVLRSPRLSLGPELAAFEEQFAAYVGTKYAVAVSSGTAALHCCIRALGISDGDEVITTPFSFIASSNCILYERAKPVFVDIDPGTLCIDPEKVAAAVTQKTQAIIPVDVFGLLADYDALGGIASKHQISIIEDSCEALGSKKGTKQAGTFGECGTFAFYPNKQMTTGEGGVITTNRKDIADACKSLRNQGRSTDGGWLAHERLGYNYRLSDIQCALGRSQLKRLPEFIKKRQRVADLYAAALKPLSEHVTLPMAQPGVDVSWFVYVIRLRERFTQENRDEILLKLRAKDIGCQNYFPPIHLQPYYRQQFGYQPGDFPITESVAARTIALPFHNNLSESDIARVAEALKESILGVV